MIPMSLQANPQLSRWVAFPSPGVVRLAFGKVEIGQGTMTALAQIAAEELDVAMSRLEVTAGDTELAPDEGLTVGSMSIESSGASLRVGCAEVRAIFLTHAARRLRCDVEALDIEDGAILRDGEATGETYWTLAPEVDLARPATGEVQPKAPGRHRLVGQSQPRLDLPAKLFGAGFIQDLALDGLRHARVLRQPGPRAVLASLDEDAIRRAVGEPVDILREGALVAVICESEAGAVAAIAAAQRHAVWNHARALQPQDAEPDRLRGKPSADVQLGAPAAAPSNRRRMSATYSRPYIAHGSMAPSCGLAQYDEGHLTVWSHTQGVYPLRHLIATALNLDPAVVTVRHVQGAGCYGHNGADDAGFDAALVALRRPGRPIRVQWSREDEFGHAPVGPAMSIDVSAELDEQGRVVDWTTEIWSGSHVNRGRLLAETALPRATPLPDDGGPGVAALPRFSGGRLNAVPSYDIPASRVIEHLILQPPVRTSALRGLGGPVNTYAGECFIDELAAAAGQDPLAYRLAMATDPRGHRVLEKVGEMSGWARRGPGGEGVGLGIGFDRHRDVGAYVAAVAEVQVEAEVRVLRLWCAADCGLIINPDGARNQLEGGMIMAASWALKEAVQLGGDGIASVTWRDYPILRFSEVPAVEIALIDAPQERPLGIGEVSSGPALAAIGNAVAHALRVRVRDMPFTRERISAAIFAA